jgi:hypothetical protein
MRDARCVPCDVNGLEVETLIVDVCDFLLSYTLCTIPFVFYHINVYFVL